MNLAPNPVLNRSADFLAAASLLSGATDLLSGAVDEMLRSVRRSLVVLHNGHSGIGAGMIWNAPSSTGMYILTNAHVAAQQDRSHHHGHAPSGGLRAALEDGREYPARLVADDPEIDLALLQIDSEGLPTIRVGDSHRLRTGQMVWAVGHPWGQRSVVTAGLVSSRAKVPTNGPRREVEVIRSDARLAPGNSGGPLVDAAGAVVGVNTMIIGGDQGIALPIHLAVEFVSKALS